MSMVSKFILLVVFIVIGAIILASKNKKMSSTTKFTINGGTFPMEAHIIITDDTAEAKQYAEDILDRKINSDDFVAEAVTLTDDLGTDFVLWFSKHSVKDTGIVHHELFHLTYSILSVSGVKLSDDTEEVYAYQLECLSDQFYKQLNQ